MSIKLKQAINFYFVTVLILFAYSGMMKWFFIIVDPTIFFALLTLPAFLLWYRFKFYDYRNPLVSTIPTFIALNILIILTGFYTISEKYFLFKTMAITLNTSIFLLPLVILRTDKCFVYFIKVFRLIFFLCILLLTYEYINNQFTRIRYRDEIDTDTIGLPNYLTFSYFLGTCIILLINYKDKLTRLLLFVAFIYMILLAAKGPLLFLLLILFFKFRKKVQIFEFKTWIYLTVILSIFFLLTYVLRITLFDTLIARLSFFSDGLDADDSSLARVILLQKGIDIIANNFFWGVGIGGYAKAIGEMDGRLSPHNIFVEIWSENGVIPLLILVFLCFLVFKKFMSVIKNPNYKLGPNLAFLCLFLFLSNMVSSYLEDLRTTYFWLGVSIAYFTMRAKSISNKI